MKRREAPARRFGLQRAKMLKRLRFIVPARRQVGVRATQRQHRAGYKTSGPARIRSPSGRTGYSQRARPSPSRGHQREHLAHFPAARRCSGVSGTIMNAGHATKASAANTRTLRPQRAESVPCPAQTRSPARCQKPPLRPPQSPILIDEAHAPAKENSTRRCATRSQDCRVTNIGTAPTAMYTASQAPRGITASGPVSPGSRGRPCFRSASPAPFRGWRGRPESGRAPATDRERRAEYDDLHDRAMGIAVIKNAPSTAPAAFRRRRSGFPPPPSAPHVPAPDGIAACMGGGVNVPHARTNRPRTPSTSAACPGETRRNQRVDSATAVRRDITVLRLYGRSHARNGLRNAGRKPATVPWPHVASRIAGSHTRIANCTRGAHDGHASRING
jgi:hypothetical protein